MSLHRADPSTRFAVGPHQRSSADGHAPAVRRETPDVSAARRAVDRYARGSSYTARRFRPRHRRREPARTTALVLAWLAGTVAGALAVTAATGVWPGRPAGPPPDEAALASAGPADPSAPPEPSPAAPSDPSDPADPADRPAGADEPERDPDPPSRRGPRQPIDGTVSLVEELTDPAAVAAGVTVPVECLAWRGNRQLGCALLPEFGFGTDQMPALNNLWTRESGWNHLAENRWSGAYGIPQALPGDKMAAFGDDWRTNPATQIRWGLHYIAQRYGSPAAAWGFFLGNGWY